MMRSTIIDIASLLLVIVIISHDTHTAVLSLSPPTPINRVAIVGSGIAGLSLAHALGEGDDGTATAESVSIYDARSFMDPKAGAGIQVSGGMAILKKIKPELYDKVAEAGRPLESISSRCANWIDPKDSFQLLNFNLLNIIQSLDAHELLNENGESIVITIMRSKLQQLLAKDLSIQFNKRLVAIKKGDHGTMLQFSDGSNDGPFDLVVGCDGVNSAVKQYVDNGNIENNARGAAGAIYSGIRIRYAVQDCDQNIQKTSFQQYFGNGAYCLTGSYGDGPNKSAKACYTIFTDPAYFGPFKKKDAVISSDPDENVDWNQDDRTDIQQLMLQQLQDCQVPLENTEAILSQASRFFEAGVYFHNPISLGGWTREVSKKGSGHFVTLCGDAAHAMPPFLGQGANQAIQDAYCLAQKIRDYNNNINIINIDNNENAEGEVDFGKLLKDYEKTRWFPTTSITAKSAILGYLEAATGPFAKFRDLFFFIMDKVGVAKKIYVGAAIPKV